MFSLSKNNITPFKCLVADKVFGDAQTLLEKKVHDSISRQVCSNVWHGIVSQISNVSVLTLHRIQIHDNFIG